MTMKALNKLVARAIIDPNTLQAFVDDNIESILKDYDFSDEMRSTLSSIHASNFAEFSIIAYRHVKAAEEAAQPRIQLPSPLEGLLPDEDQQDDEQVA